jgi:hypothetical protein
MTIELDTAGNLWIAQTNKLHVLKRSNAPTWLSVYENQSAAFQLFPNPSSGEIHFSGIKGTAPTTIEVLGADGRLVESLPYADELTLSVNAGVYLIRLLRGEEEIGVTRCVIR